MDSNIGVGCLPAETTSGYQTDGASRQIEICDSDTETHVIIHSLNLSNELALFPIRVIVCINLKHA